MESINNNNYELWLVRYADGDLTAAERAAVEQWLEGHPEAAEELKLYGEAPRLEREESVHYAAAVPGRVQLLWPAVLRWSAAAAVVALVAVPLGLWLTNPAEEPLQVAATEMPGSLAKEYGSTVADTVSPVHEVITVVKRHSVSASGSAACSVAAEQSVDNVITDEPFDDAARCVPTEEPLLAAAEVSLPAADTALRVPTEEPVAVDMEAPGQQLVYVDNLFTVDSGNVVEQRLLAVNEPIKERLQGTYLGRRLARRMPTGEELLDYTDNLRERTPEGVRMMADMVLAYNESNK